MVKKKSKNKESKKEKEIERVKEIKESEEEFEDKSDEEFSGEEEPEEEISFSDSMLSVIPKKKVKRLENLEEVNLEEVAEERKENAEGEEKYGVVEESEVGGAGSSYDEKDGERSFYDVAGMGDGRSLYGDTDRRGNNLYEEGGSTGNPYGTKEENGNDGFYDPRISDDNPLERDRIRVAGKSKLEIIGLRKGYTKTDSRMKRDDNQEYNA